MQGRWAWTGAMLAFMTGAALQLQRAELGGSALAVGALLVGLAAAACAWPWPSKWSSKWPSTWPSTWPSAWHSRLRPQGRLGLALLGLLGVALVAYALTDLRAAWRLQDRLDPALEGRDLVLIGVVAEMPRLAATGPRFVFEVESVEPAAVAGTVPSRVSLGWFLSPSGDAGAGLPLPELRAGDRWRLSVRLRQVHGALNPGGLDLELWLFERGIGATGFVRAGSQLLGASLQHPVERLRQKVRDAILRRVADPVAAGVIAALAVGDQAAIDSEGWELFRNTGVAHLMSISGLHVTLFAWLAAAAVGAAWRRSERLSLAVPAPSAARVGGVALAAAYALLAGWGVPAQRTVLMLVVVTALRLGAWRWPPLNVLLAAATAVTFADPWALLQPGFWLSFAAVALLMASGTQREGASPSGASSSAATEVAMVAEEAAWVLHARGLRERALAALKTQVVATVGLAPLTLVFFQQVSVVGFVANLLAIPLVTLVVTPLSLAGMGLPMLWDVAALAVGGLMHFLQALAAWPGAVWSAAAVPLPQAALGLLGGALAVLPLPWRLRAAGLAMVLPLVLTPSVRPPPGAFEVVAADVGQGTAVIVRTHKHLLMYDAGPQYSPEADAGQRVLLPLLRWRGERAVDLLVLSHRDADHVGGAASLMRSLPVRELSSSLEPWHPLLAFGPPHRPCEATQRWVWDGVVFEMLHPLAASQRSTAAVLRPNALSCVLSVSAADGSRLLLSGDIEAPQEAELLARGSASLHSQVLLVPHHGSTTSSTAAFIDAVQPRVAMAQAGYRSRFGHPAPAVEQRYRERGIDFVRSDRCGAWTWRSGQAQGQCERLKRQRYWHHRPG